jgi:archaellum component FlaC
MSNIFNRCLIEFENLNKRIAELEAENNRLRAETTRTIIPESAYTELKEDYEEMESDFNNMCKDYRELREKYDAIIRDNIPPTSEYQKLVDSNVELRKQILVYKSLLGEQRN